MKALTATKTHSINLDKSDNLPRPQFPCLERDDLGTSLPPWLRCHTSTAGAQFWPLVGGLRSNTLQGAHAKKKVGVLKYIGICQMTYHRIPERCPKQKKFQVK